MQETPVAKEIYQRIIHADSDKEIQVRITVSEFREVEYLHIRKYYQDFHEVWQPSSDGISIPLDLSNCKELFIALLEILSLAESKNLIQEHFSDIMSDLYIK